MDLAGLLEEHGDHLLRLCTLYLGDRSQAEDAVQDTFLRALRAWPGFRGDCAVETWLVRIAINVCKRQLRSPWRLLRAPQESLDSLRMEGPEPPDDTLVRAIQALPPKYREVIILYYYQEWKAWEIAQRLHVPVSTVTVRLSRARPLPLQPGPGAAGKAAAGAGGGVILRHWGLHGRPERGHLPPGAGLVHPPLPEVVLQHRPPQGDLPGRLEQPLHR